VRTNLWHLGVDFSALRCQKQKHNRGGHILLNKFFFFNLLLLILGAPYISYTVYRDSLLEIERPGKIALIDPRVCALINRKKIKDGGHLRWVAKLIIETVQSYMIWRRVNLQK
jgi:hypothetical protein